jgi:hypothetical protein
MTMTDPRRTLTTADLPDGALDACFSLTLDGPRAHLTLRGSFDDRAAEQVAELLDWLVAQGPAHVTADVVDEPTASDGFAFRRLNTLARARGAILGGGGSLHVRAAARLERTLAAMRLVGPLS